MISARDCVTRPLLGSRSLTSIAGALGLAGAFLLYSCATTTPSQQQFRTFLVPPTRVTAPPQELPEGPQVMVAALYPNEVPSLPTPIAILPRPSDTDFLLKRADDRFNAGKKAFQESRYADARREFDRAIEMLLTAPDNIIDRARVERHTEELVEAIYRYDVDQLGASDSSDQVVYDESPLDSILEMTFPVDPGLRSRVSEQIRATTSQLPLEESDAVLSYINFFSSERGKKILAGGLKRSGRYKALIEKVLGEEGLPQELIFLAQAESGFLPRAMSNKRCVGLWQFAQFRGKEYGLEKTSFLDERMDPEKATRAAAHHLHDLYSHFGDWNLAMAAYNCGPGCVDHAVMRTGYADFWTLRRLNVLPKETSNYVPLILAMTIISKNAKDYGLDELEFDPPMSYDTVEIETPTSLSLVADAVDRPISSIRELNPSLLSTLAPAGYRLHLPSGTSDSLDATFRAVPPNRRDSWRVHRLESGESLAGLAKKFNTQTSALIAANHDETPEPGALIAIPVAYPSDRKVRTASVRSGKASKTVTKAAAVHTGASLHSTTANKPSAAAAHAAPAGTAKHTTGSAATQHKATAQKPAVSAPKSAGVPSKTAALAPKPTITRAAHRTTAARTPNS